MGEFLEKNYKIVVVVLLCILFLQAVTSIRNKSITVDEISHLSSGYSYIKTGDFRLNVEALPLIDMFSALPLLFLDPELPLDHSSWINAKILEYEGQYHWEFGNQFFFHYNDNPDKILFFGRIPVMLLSVLLGFFVFKFAKELYGVKAGLFALFLYSFSPNILAHSRIATADLGSSCLIFISVYYFWRFLKKISIKSLIIAGITLGLAELSKFTALYLIPVYFILAFVFLYKNKKETSLAKLLTHKKTHTLLGLLLIIFIIAFFVVLAGFGFKGFPAYVSGLKYATWHASSQLHPSYLFGKHSTEGWWYYYIAAFLIKTPIATLIFIILSLVLFNKIKSKDSVNEFFLIIPVAVLIIFSFFNRINIGLRHILAVYPFIFVFVSKITNFAKKKGTFIVIIVLLCLSYVIGSLMIYPHYLAYFNEVVKADNGHKYLLDSNLDWGQDLKGLKNYMEKNGINNIILGYWGKDNIEVRGISYRMVNCYPEPGLIAVSANTLYGLREERTYCMEWLREYEPIDKIGYSIFIYNITDEIDVSLEREKFCKKGCLTGCAEINREYGRSYYANGSCQCECK